MSWPLTLPFSEAQKYRGQLDESIQKFGGNYNRRFAMMRHASVYETETDRNNALNAVRHVLGQFGNLMLKKGEVVNGFPESIPLQELDGNFRVDPVMLEENLVFGSPQQVIDKIKLYQSMGVDSFIYYASMGLELEQQKRSLELFIDKVIPHFR